MGSSPVEVRVEAEVDRALDRWALPGPLATALKMQYGTRTRILEVGWPVTSCALQSSDVPHSAGGQG